MESNFMFRLRKALGDKGITRTELSQISGVAKGDITHYLKGDYVPKQDKCYLLAKALDVDPGWLMTGYEQNTEEIINAIEESIPQTEEASFKNVLLYSADIDDIITAFTPLLAISSSSEAVSNIATLMLRLYATLSIIFFRGKSVAVCSAIFSLPLASAESKSSDTL